MRHATSLDLKSVCLTYWPNLLVTWLLLALEITLLALIPLFVGYAIDGLLKGDWQDLIIFAGLLVVLTLVAVIRRAVDTRVFGQMRVELGLEVDKRLNALPVGVRNARLTMSREIIDFLETDVPELFSAVIQVVAAIVILASFAVVLSLSAITTLILILLVYALFHRRFTKLNAVINNQVERQVNCLAANKSSLLKAHLLRLKRGEIKLSDSEAIVYGFIFLILFSFLIFNLVEATSIDGVTAGAVFSIVAYSLEYLESSLTMPMVLQQLSRVSEISKRMNDVRTPHSNLNKESNQ